MLPNSFEKGEAPGKYRPTPERPNMLRRIYHRHRIHRLRKQLIDTLNPIARLADADEHHNRP